jgi:hypothetical protein
MKIKPTKNINHRTLKRCVKASANINFFYWAWNERRKNFSLIFDDGNFCEIL